MLFFSRGFGLIRTRNKKKRGGYIAEIRTRRKDTLKNIVYSVYIIYEVLRNIFRKTA